MDRIKLTKTLTVFEVAAESKYIKSQCISIIFTVPDTSNPVVINGMPVGVGQSLEITQENQYIDDTQYELVFEPGLGVNQVNIARMVLKDNSKYI